MLYGLKKWILTLIGMIFLEAFAQGRLGNAYETRGYRLVSLRPAHGFRDDQVGEVVQAGQWLRSEEKALFGSLHFTRGALGAAVAINGPLEGIHGQHP